MSSRSIRTGSSRISGSTTTTPAGTITTHRRDKRMERTGEERGDGEADDEHDRPSTTLPSAISSGPDAMPAADGEHGERNG